MAELINTSPGWINERLRKIERAIEGLRTERRAAATTISSGDLILSGGGKLVVDGGDFLLLDTDGSTVFRLGPQQFGDRGVSIYREVGTPVLEVAKQNAVATQAWRMKDGNGQVIVSESALTGGLSRPRLPLQPFPVSTPTWGTYGPEVSTTSGTFVTAFAVQDRRQNPVWAPAFRVACSDTSTAAEIRVINAATGLPLDIFGGGAWLGTRAAGSVGYDEILPALSVPPSVAFEARFRFEVQVRRTVGTGTVTVAVPESVGG